LAAKETTRCKLSVMDHNGGIIADEFMASTTLDLSAMQGGGTVNLFPQGTVTFEYIRCPLVQAFLEPGDSANDWKNIALNQTRMARLHLINIVSGTGLHAGKTTHVNVGDFKDAKLNKTVVAGGTKSGEDGQTSRTEDVKSRDDGVAEFNQPFLFLTPQSTSSFSLDVQQKGMVSFGSVGNKRVVLSKAAKMNLDIGNGASVSLEMAYFDLDIGVMGLVNSAERARVEAELAAIAEKERQEAEAEKLAAEAAAAALIAAQQAEYEAEMARKKAEDDTAAAAAATEAEAKALAAREEATLLQAEEDKLWQTKVKKLVAAAGVAAAAAWAATCMYGSWGIERANESLEKIQARATAYLDGNPEAGAAVDKGLVKAYQAMDAANDVAKKGVVVLGKASEKGADMAKKGIDMLAGKFNGMKKLW
jgi:hypothetical protein